MFDRIWTLVLIVVGAYVIFEKIGKGYFWISDKTAKIITAVVYPKDSDADSRSFPIDIGTGD